MKGIVLSGGTATRLFPLTATTSKHLLPVYDRQMIFYPLNTLIKAGIKDILIIVAPEYSGQYINLLAPIFKNRGVNLYFEVQNIPKGLADAFIIGESFIGKDNVAMILGDNIFEDNLGESIKNFKKGGMIFAKEVTDPERFGVANFDKSGKVLAIEEKPKNPKSNYAVTGIYVYDNRVIKFAKELKPSSRGEIEITDINNKYLELGELVVNKIKGIWLDAGTCDALLEAGNAVKKRGISKKFNPIVNQAIEEFNQDLTNRVKASLREHNLILRK